MSLSALRTGERKEKVPDRETTSTFPTMDQPALQKSLIVSVPRHALGKTFTVDKGSPNQTSSDFLPKLKVGQQGDAYEREADRISEAVISAERTGEIKEETEVIQRKTETGTPGASSGVAEGLLENVGVGIQLDPTTRGFMESRFGHDFGQVQIHTDSKAAKSAEAVSALAYTVGHEIVFGEGQYDMTSNRGKKLLAHELVHVLQQGAVDRNPSRKIVGRLGARTAAPLSIQRQATSGSATQPDPNSGAQFEMTKITNGQLKGGKTMENYYGHPANGEWAHGGTAGPFVTSQWVGSNIQIFGTVPSPSDPTKFSFNQTATFTKYKLSDQTDSKQGQSFPDAPVPNRQTWSGNPPGLNISTADAPAVDYKTNIGSSLEVDRAFVTSLTGPSGQKSISWSTSIVVRDGKIITNWVK